VIDRKIFVIVVWWDLVHRLYFCSCFWGLAETFYSVVSVCVFMHRVTVLLDTTASTAQPDNSSKACDQTVDNNELIMHQVKTHLDSALLTLCTHIKLCSRCGSRNTARCWSRNTARCWALPYFWTKSSASCGSRYLLSLQLMATPVCNIHQVLATIRQMFSAFAACITWPFGTILYCMNTKTSTLILVLARAVSVTWNT